MWHAASYIIYIFKFYDPLGKEEFIVRKFKKALAVALSVAMMVPTVAFAAESPAKVDVNGAKFNKTTLTYTAKAQKPSITVNGKTLVYGKDFTVKSGRLTQKAAGTYKVTIAGIGSYTGTKTLTYTIKKAAQSKVKAVAKAKTYNGKKQMTSVKVSFNGVALKKGVDYTIAKSSVVKATNAGKYTVKVVGKGNFTGTKTITYTIKKAAQSKAKFAVNSAKKKVAVSGIKAKAKVTYTTNNKKVSVKNGKIIVKKGVKKGTKVTITAKIASTKNYAAKTIKKTYVVK